MPKKDDSVWIPLSGTRPTRHEDSEQDREFVPSHLRETKDGKDYTYSDLVWAWTTNDPRRIVQASIRRIQSKYQQVINAQSYGFLSAMDHRYPMGWLSAKGKYKMTVGPGRVPSPGIRPIVDANGSEGKMSRIAKRLRSLQQMRHQSLLGDLKDLIKETEGSVRPVGFIQLEGWWLEGKQYDSSGPERIYRDRLIFVVNILREEIEDLAGDYRQQSFLFMDEKETNGRTYTYKSKNRIRDFVRAERPFDGFKAKDLRDAYADSFDAHSGKQGALVCAGLVLSPFNDLYICSGRWGSTRTRTERDLEAFCSIPHFRASTRVVHRAWRPAEHFYLYYHTGNGGYMDAFTGKFLTDQQVRDHPSMQNRRPRTSSRQSLFAA